MTDASDLPLIEGNVKQYLWPVMMGIEQRIVGQDLGVRTGFADLDTVTTGWNEGDLILVGGMPGSGRTSLLASLAFQAAVAQRPGHTVFVFTPHMLAERFVERLLSVGAVVEPNCLRAGNLRDDDYPRLARVAGELNTSLLFFKDDPRMLVDELSAYCARLATDGITPDLIVVDGLHALHATPRPDIQNREQEVACVARELKALAISVRAPVVASASLSRAAEYRPAYAKRPQLSDFRDSGELENIADTVIFLHPSQNDGAETEMIVAKNLHGPRLTVRLGAPPWYSNALWEK